MNPFHIQPNNPRKLSRCASLIELKRLQKKATNAVCKQTRSDCLVRVICLKAVSCHGTKSVKPGKAVGLTYWLVHVSLLASESVTFPLEDWRKAHTLQAKLATLQKLGTCQSSNQNPPMFTKCHYLQKTSSHTQTCLNFRGVCL